MAGLAKTNVELMCRLNKGQAKAKAMAQAKDRVLREKNSELMVRLANLEQAGDTVKAAEVRDELVIANIALVTFRATWFLYNWKGRPPAPTVQELVSIGNTAVVTAARKIPATWEEPTQYFRTTIDRAMARESFTEHIRHRLPSIKDDDGKKHQVGMAQLEISTDDEDGKIAWGGHDDTIAAVFAGDAPPDADRKVREMVEVMLHVCEGDLDRQIVTMYADYATADGEDRKLTQQQVADALGQDRTTIITHLNGIRARYTAYLTENPPGTRPTTQGLNCFGIKARERQKARDREVRRRNTHDHP